MRNMGCLIGSVSMGCSYLGALFFQVHHDPRGTFSASHILRLTLARQLFRAPATASDAAARPISASSANMGRARPRTSDSRQRPFVYVRVAERKGGPSAGTISVVVILVVVGEVTQASP